MSQKVENRNQTVLEAAVGLAVRVGFHAVTRPRVAAETGYSVGTVSNAFGCMEGLREAVMAAAVERELLDVVGQGLALRHPVALNAPADLRSRALDKIAA